MPQDWNERFRQSHIALHEHIPSDMHISFWQTVYANASDACNEFVWKRKERRTKLGNSLD